MQAALRRPSNIVWLAAFGGLVLAVLAAYPGYMSWDSAYQWWQARHGQFEATHPPLMAMLWQLTDRAIPGPGGMFLVQQAMLWLALGGFAAALPCRAGHRVLVVLALGLWPPVFGVSAYLWKDVWTLGAFAMAAALLAAELGRPSRLRLASALALLALACSFRHNAITGAVPLVLWTIHRWPGPATRPAWRTMFVALMASAMVWGAAKLPELDPRVKPVDSVWSVVTLWDAAAVSIREGTLVYPPELVDPSLTIEELSDSFVDYSNGTVFLSGKLNHSFDGPYSPQERAALRRLAWELPTRHATSYFRHRLRVSEMLFGWDRASLPDGQVFWPILHGYGDNPPLEVERSPLQLRVAAGLVGMVDTPWFAGWIYLVVSALVLVLGWRRRASPLAGLAAALAASALCYALPLSLASGSSEFRYMVWPVLACLMGLVLYLLSTRSRRDIGRKPLATGGHAGPYTL
jgi:hypothetical protein